MPERLVEALDSLREARMTDHRDVTSYGTCALTPCVATVLEDHAMELIASTLHVHPKRLAEVLQRRKALGQADRQIAGQLTAGFNYAWPREHHEGRADLEKRSSTTAPADVWCPSRGPLPSKPRSGPFRCQISNVPTRATLSRSTPIRTGSGSYSLRCGTKQACSELGIDASETG